MMAKDRGKKAKAKAQRKALVKAELEEFPFQFVMPDEIEADDDEDIVEPIKAKGKRPKAKRKDEPLTASDGLLRLRVITIVMDLDDADDLQIGLGDDVSPLEAYAMLDRARIEIGPRAYGPAWHSE